MTIITTSAHDRFLEIEERVRTGSRLKWSTPRFGGGDCWAYSNPFTFDTEYQMFVRGEPIVEVRIHTAQFFATTRSANEPEWSVKLVTRDDEQVVSLLDKAATPHYATLCDSEQATSRYQHLHQAQAAAEFAACQTAANQVTNFYPYDTDITFRWEKPNDIYLPAPETDWHNLRFSPTNASISATF